MSTCVDTFWRFFITEIDGKFDFACARELTRSKKCPTFAPFSFACARELTLQWAFSLLPKFEFSFACARELTPSHDGS